MEQNERLIERLDQGRRALQGMMVGLDQGLEICPGWTIKELLAHVAGWDEVATAALRAHASGTVPAPLDPPGIDDCNEIMVRKCEALVARQWRIGGIATRLLQRRQRNDDGLVVEVVSGKRVGSEQEPIREW